MRCSLAEALLTLRRVLPVPARLLRPVCDADLRSTAKAAEYKAAYDGEGLVPTQRDLSRIIADEWHSEDVEVRAAYKQEAELRRLEYQAALAGMSGTRSPALIGFAEATPQAKRRMNSNTYGDAAVTSAAPSPSPKRTRPALERSGWSDPLAIMPAHRTADRLRLLTAGHDRPPHARRASCRRRGRRA